MSIEDFHSHFEGVNFQGLHQQEKGPKLSLLEEKVEQLAANIPQNLTESDIAQLKALASKISMECPGTKLDKLFRQLMVGIPDLYPNQTALLSEPAPRPVEGNRLDPEQLASWANAHPSNVRDAVTALGSTVHCISQEEFEKSLHQSLDQLNNIMPKGLEYRVAVQEGKSNLWVAQLATQSGKLDTHPVGAIPLAFDRGTCPKNVVLFDDASISGEQMERIVKQFITRSKDENSPLDNIYVVVPYMTTSAQERIKAIAPEGKPQIYLIVAKTLPTISEALSEQPEHVKTLNNLLAPSVRASAFDKEMTSSIRESLKITTTLTPYFFAHKVPDKKSFPQTLANGSVLLRKGVPQGGNYRPILQEVTPYKDKESMTQPPPHKKEPAFKPQGETERMDIIEEE